MSASERQLAALEASITRSVNLRHGVVYWTMKDKMKRVVGGLNIMEKKEQAVWKKRAFKGYSICDHILTTSAIPKIKRAKRLLKKALAEKDRRLTREVKDGLIELGVMYQTIRSVAETGLKVFDATYSQYGSIPIPGFDPPEDQSEDDMTWTPMEERDFAKQQRTTHSVTDRMDQMADATATQDSDIPSFEQVLKDVDEEEDVEVLVADGDD